MLIKNKKESGFTLIEVMIALLILSMMLVSIINIQYFMSKQGVRAREQTFATQKAIQLMEEMRSLVSGAEKTNISVLDDYDDGSSYNPVLTTEPGVADPAGILSDNKPLEPGWKYLRQIQVIKLPNEPFSRRVYVRIYKSDPSNPSVPGETLAETVSVLKTITSEYVPTAGLDVFILCLENVPGWWTSLSLMRPMFDSVIQDIQTRNPGLEIRTHWITRLAYGRDKQYTPYINNTDYTNDTSMPAVYFYPGLMRKSDGSDFYYYDPDQIQGRINAQGTVRNSGSYSMADMYNHAMRYPEEEALYDNAVSNAYASGQVPPEMSYRMLLEKMISDPDSLKNILLINLHGELIPLPPIRNYSDAAKDPESFPNVRIVTHPEQLRYETTDETHFRVYPYVMTPNSFSSTSTLAVSTLFFPDDNISDFNIAVDKISGGTTADYARAAVTASTFTFQITHPSGGTLITFYQTPVRHSTNTFSNKGLPAAKRLYGLEYIPCAVHPAGTPDFTYDLTNNNINNPKNTARWIVKISAGALAAGRHAFETRVGSDLTTGTSGNKPANLSRSYVWIGAEPPFTEKYQFMGDARHMPYKDCKRNDYYNWYFRDIASGDYQGFTKAEDGWNDTADWGGDDIDVDVPRYFQMLRSALLNTNAVWSTMNGVSFFYYGIGGEFGGDVDPFPSGIPFRMLPWSTSGDTSATYVDEMLPAEASAANKYSRIVATTNNSWYAKPWIGELYPDSAYATWVTNNGNLPTGSGNYYRAVYNTFTDLGFTRCRCLSYMGSGSFMNGGPSSSGGPFRHGSGTYTGSLTAPLGLNLSSSFNFPLLSSISAPRPFTLDYGSSGRPPEWNDTEYNKQRTTLSVPSISGTPRIYYESSYSASSYDASSVVKMSSSTSSACYLVVSGLNTQANFGTAQMGKLDLISMIRAFLDGGQQSAPGIVPQIPLVEISAPTVSDTFNNPTTIDMQWGASWKRWDGEKYTEEYPAGYSETTSIVYAVKYSNDNGRHWYYCSDNSATTAGEKDYPLHTTSLNTISWFAATMPRGTYIIRVECYRRDLGLHYSYDQVGIYINR